MWTTVARRLRAITEAGPIRMGGRAVTQHSIWSLQGSEIISLVRIAIFTEFTRGSTGTGTLLESPLYLDPGKVKGSTSKGSSIGITTSSTPLGTHTQVGRFIH